MNKRPSPFRMWIGGLCQRAAWWCCNPHDSWMIDYRMEDHACALTHRGSYHTALLRARELGGRISGWHAYAVRDDEVPA